MHCYWASRYTRTNQPAAETEDVVWLIYCPRPQVSAVNQLLFDWLHQQHLLAE